MTRSMKRESRLEVWAPDGLPELGEATDLAETVAAAVDLADGDIVVVTSKVVSKVEGRVRVGDRERAVEEETRRVVARRGPTMIVRNRLGLTMAAAGVDASNVVAGSIVLLPLDPDASARRLRTGLQRITGSVVGVVVTDTAGRAWREGQTDIAIGAAGLRVSEDFSGRTDPYGNDLVVTLPAVADEIASAAELAQGKLAGRPLAVLRGRGDLVLDRDDDGSGAAALIRPEGADLFGYGAREAVLRALVGHPDDQLPFGSPVDPGDLLVALGRVGTVSGTLAGDAVDLVVGDSVSRTAVAAVAFAHGWVLESWESTGDGVRARARPATT